MIGTEYSALTVNVLKEKGHFFKDSVRTFQWVEISGFPLGVEFSPRLDEQRQKAGKFRFDRGNDFGRFYGVFFQIFNTAEAGNQGDGRF